MLRATAITRLLEELPVQEVQVIVQHASSDTTLRYWRRDEVVGADHPIHKLQKSYGW